MSNWQPDLPYTGLICRYNEIATKGRNRFKFEDYLMGSLRRVLAPLGPLHLEKAHGRIFVERKGSDTVFSPDALALIRRVIPTVAGVSSVSPGFKVEPTLDAVEAVVDATFEPVYEAFCKAFPVSERTYAMRVNRVNKAFPMTATDVEILFAKKLMPSHPDLSLDLKHGKLRIDVEFRYHQAFVSYERIDGPGGLPVGTGGRVLALLSGGIDSPVACFQMMRRGCAVDFITFHSEPYTPPAYLTKVMAIARKLNEYQRFGRLFAVNLLAAQKAVRDNCRSRYRTVLYRRFMLRIAEQIAERFHEHALVTGDNIGQVASQTLRNMSVINAAVHTLVLRPLLTYDKLDTMAIAEKIGTMDLSSEQVPDSCTVFAPDDPATSTELFAIERDEANIDVAALIQECLAATVVIRVETGEAKPLSALEHEAADDVEEGDCCSVDDGAEKAADCPGAIVDLDGTILDSLPLWRRLDMEYLASKGKTISPEISAELKARGIEEASRYIKEHFDLAEDVQTISTEILDRIRYVYEETAPLFPDAKQFLQDLRAKGTRLALFSAAKYDYVVKCLKRHGIYDWFDCVVSSMDLHIEKSDPEAYLRVLERLGTARERTVIYEDAPYAIEGALQTGMKVITMEHE